MEPELGIQGEPMWFANVCDEFNFKVAEINRSYDAGRLRGILKTYLLEGPVSVIVKFSVVITDGICGDSEASISYAALAPNGQPIQKEAVAASSVLATDQLVFKELLQEIIIKAKTRK